MSAHPHAAALKLAAIPLLSTSLVGASLPGADPPPDPSTSPPPTSPVITAPAAIGPVAALPLGKPGLREKRTVEQLADGVTLTKIHRGKGKAKAKRITKTKSGPWRVNVLTIDPQVARGRLTATFGPSLAKTEPTTTLTRLAGGLAGVNASYFTFTGSKKYPGDPVGLGLYDGRLLSEPTGRYGEVGVLLDAGTGQVQLGPLRWSGIVRNKVSDASVDLSAINHPPVVPRGCAKNAEPDRCLGAGEAVAFTPEFGSRTAVGAGVEVVLDRAGCVVRSREKRGTGLLPGQTSLQGTGQSADAVRQVAVFGCLDTEETLTDRLGVPVELTSDLYGVAARYPLVTAGVRVGQPGGGGYNGRNPRTLIGTGADGRILLVTIDGKRPSSVGTTLTETAKVAKSLGMQDAVNLDGGGSTTMSVRGTLANKPSGRKERSVGDALVFVPSTEPPTAP